MGIRVIFELFILPATQQGKQPLGHAGYSEISDFDKWTGLQAKLCKEKKHLLYMGSAIFKENELFFSKDKLNVKELGI
ncbi:MAG: hypothetical protein LPK25_14850 [Cyclobacteriaceae bacterium]|nr:hypothetical protein [Cyclobacteriaceae bacterium]